MMKHLEAELITVFMAIMLICTPCIAEDSSTTPEPYKPDEFPQFMKDTRRAEIITLGALPFVTLDATLTYSFIRYWQHDFSSDYAPNPFAKSSDSNGFTTEEQTGILLTSIGISVGIGITDLIVTVIRRNAGKMRERKESEGPVKIKPIDEDKDAVKLPPPAPYSEEQQNSENPKEESNRNMLPQNISAVAEE